MPVALLLALSMVRDTTIVITEARGTSVPSNRRSPIHLDPIEATLLDGQPINSAAWKPLRAGKDGWFDGAPLNAGHVAAEVDSPTARKVLLAASGHSVAYVNGAIRTGDPYQYGYTVLPIQLQQGKNQLLFQCGRGRLRVELRPVTKPIELDAADPTMPDVIAGKGGRAWGAIIVRNATDAVARGLRIEAGGVGTRLGDIPAMGTRKVGFQFSLPADGKLAVRLIGEKGELDTTAITLRVRKPNEAAKRTFVSEIDGSVQYYAVLPSARPGPGQALFLSLHGASVEAIGQAEAYSPKTWGHVVAATNRRPYGFDWEDVGRLDALEVLDHAKRELNTDPSLTYLTGHSMGGHGTWINGAIFPDRFAAIAPSAGWSSFASYGGGATFGDSEIDRILRRAASGSDTLALKGNYAAEGVYVLHGDADDNVPVTEARDMRAALAPFQRDLDFHEEPKANHWWDATEEAGADAVDWAPIFDMFARHRLPNPAEVKDIDFTTASPGISARFRWATIDQQTHAFMPSRVILHADPVLRRFRGTTANVAHLTLSVAPLIAGAKKSVDLELDGQKLTVIPAEGLINLGRSGEQWTVDAPVPADQKNPMRYGGFKDIIRNRVVLVYATHGSPEENEWAREKARYDAETFWYRGNGSVDIVADAEFSPARYRDRNVLIYGNSVSNAAWGPLLGSGPVQTTASGLTIDGRAVAGTDLAFAFIRPRPDSATASVGAIGGTGLIGCRLANRLPIFLSGAGFPDLLVVDRTSLAQGTKGVRAAGFFGMDWSVKSGDFAWAN